MPQNIDFVTKVLYLLFQHVQGQILMCFHEIKIISVSLGKVGFIRFIKRNWSNIKMIIDNFIEHTLYTSIILIILQKAKPC